MAGLIVNQGAALIRESWPVRFAAFPSGIQPAKVPIRAASHPVMIERRTGNRRNTLDFREKTWE